MNLATELDFKGYELSCEIEKLPASEQQTRVSILAVEYREMVQKEIESLKENHENIG